MWTKQQFQDYANEVAYYAQHYVKPALDYLTTNKTVVGLEAKLPHGDKVIASLGGADRALDMALGFVPYVSEAFTAYGLYKSFGGKPMTQLGFDAQEASRGSQE